MSKVVLAICLSVFVVLCNAWFIIPEGGRGIVVRFGKVLRDEQSIPVVYQPGLHVKWPLVSTVKILDARIQTLDNQADRFVTKEKKDLIVDSYIKWRISDFSRYYLATGGGDLSRAELLLKRKFSDRLRSEIGRLDVKDIVTDSRGRLTTDVRDTLNKGSANVEQDESDLGMPTQVDPAEVDNLHVNSMAALGIDVVDVRIKQINLPAEVSEAIFNRMRAERESVARSQRSQGKEEAEKLRAQADYGVTKTLSEAQKQALILRGEGEAEAAAIFATTYSQDPQFFSFLRSLSAYEKSFQSSNSLLFLDADSEFLRFMKSP
ncbi:protease modulator HflC [Rosenbergiella australiborealis]|uniref:Protein HflC n=1 Tax=Rosenbergiella australiborealis TaxID=1544696 RepID=A0ABS5T129_9GAMM|nr:protease modulator HflC [Rosenbergiella australiborealis]MBT0726053.1 protease modulator HflC [Rosenbergiella australiborealis]